MIAADERKQAFARGEERYRAGAYAEASEIFLRLAMVAGDDAAALRMLGSCRMRLGDAAQGLDMLTRARALAPNDPQTVLQYGLGLHAVGRYRDAATQFRHCHKLVPNDPGTLLNLATALLADGDASAALDAAQSARRRAPHVPQACYMVGAALLATGRADRAIESFNAALRLAPTWADAWANLGVGQYRRGDIAAAKRSMQRALSAQPGHRSAAGNLGAFMWMTGEAEQGEAALRETLARDPANAEARIYLALCLLQDERAADALAVLDEQREPADPRLATDWRLQHSLALLEVGRADEARAILARFGNPSPAQTLPLLWRRALLAIADGNTTAARQHVEQMEAALTNSTALLPEHRVITRFDLARFWSQQGEPDKAFAHWTEGHRLLSRSEPFSRDSYRQFIDAMISRLDRRRLHDQPRADNRDPAPVFIVGMPRSGTTLVEQVIGAHAQAFAAGERVALGRTFVDLAGSETPEGVARIAALDAGALNRAAVGYLDSLHALAPNARRIVDKMPGNFNQLGLVALMLPAARIVHCVRDPRDIGLSIFTLRFGGHHPYAHDLATLGWYITQHNRLMEHWCEAMPNPILTLHLKEWVDDFTGTLRRVLDFLDLPHDPACERFYAQDTRVLTASRYQVREPVNARGIGRWRAYEKQLQPLIAELAERDAL
jgi:tetratricopeptide (TPR) repeat protein